MDRVTLRPEQFAPRDLGDQSPRPGPVEIVIRFDAAVVRWVRERQHYSLFDERPAADGSTVMVYRPRSFEQMESWLLGWGDKMEVLEPAGVRQRLAEVAAGMLRRHEGRLEIGD
jgi:predicted DNA-binding transcriptional regulator YafY